MGSGRVSLAKILRSLSGRSPMHDSMFIRNLLFHIKIYSTTIWTYNSLTITFCLWTFSRLKLCNLCSNLFDFHCQNYIWVSEKLASFSAQIIIAKFQNVFDGARRPLFPGPVPLSLAYLPTICNLWDFTNNFNHLITNQTHLHRIRTGFSEISVKITFFGPLSIKIVCAFTCEKSTCNSELWEVQTLTTLHWRRTITPFL